IIAENGLGLQLLGSTGIGLLLDQEMAYDWAHPLYLEKSMLVLGFPNTLVKSLISLFFNNRVQINLSFQY
ncbi:hypothetical protein BC941DRAFT_362537, partial [Chlamydoabsidia padenii]